MGVMESGIYEIVNMVNGKMYIGSAVDLRHRKRNHVNMLNSGEHHNPHLQSAWKKHRPEAFVFSTVEYVAKHNLIAREQYWIDAYDAVTGGYNICPVAGSNLGLKFSAESRKKLSESHMGQVSWLKGKKGYTNGGSFKKGVAKPKEMIEKMRSSLRGNVPWNKGKTGCYSDKTRAAMGVANKGNSHHLGKRHSERTKKAQSIRASNISDETRARMSVAQKKRYADR